MADVHQTLKIPTGLTRKQRKLTKRLLKKGLRKLVPVKLLQLPAKARTTYEDILTVIAFADLMKTSVETVGSNFEGPSQDRVMDYLQKLTPDKVECLTKECVKEIASRLRRLRRVSFNVAIDFTYILYYGDHEKNPYVIGIKNTRGTNYAFVFCVVSIVVDGIRYVLYVFPVTKETDNVNLQVERAIKSTTENGIRISVLFLDREFYVAEVVDFIQRNRIRYLIPAVQNDKFRRTVELHTKFPEKLPVQIEGYEIDGKITVTTTLIIMEKEDEKGEKHIYGFITNLPDETYRNEVNILSDLYGKRWGIETTFRVEDKFDIYTTTRNGVIRYFFFVMSCILYNFWVTVNFIPQKSSVDTGNFAIKLRVDEMKTVLLTLIGFDFRSERLIQAQSLLAAAIFDVEKDEVSAALFSPLHLQNIWFLLNICPLEEQSGQIYLKSTAVGQK